MALTLMQIGKTVAPVVGGLLADYWFIKAPFIFSMFSLMILLWLVAIREPLKVNHKFSRSDFDFIDKIKLFLADRRLRGLGEPIISK